MINQEEVYKWLNNGDYGKLIDLLHQEKEAIKSDDILSHAAQISVNEILRVSKEKKKPNDDFIDNLERLNLIHVGKFFRMTDEQHKELIGTLIKFCNNDLKRAYQFARQYPDEDFAKSIIEEFEKSQPKEIEHAQSGYIKLTHNNEIEEVDYRISLFKSKEEQKMFLAFKRIFDTFQIYPNVALSNLIDYKKIKEQLSSNELRYFFNASIDLVVFEPFKQYEPIYFFELDSIWHDNENAKGNDKMKDKIFSMAGLKLFRIRDKKNLKIDEEEFEELVKEVRALIENKGKT